MAFGPCRCYQRDAVRGFDMRQLTTFALLIALAAPAAAQGTPPDPESEPPIDDVVASALVARGRALFDAGDYQSAKQLFIEALERSPSSTEALSMLRATNEKLGVDRDLGRPGTEAPMDPYSAKGEEAPMDPYGEPGKPAGPDVKEQPPTVTDAPSDDEPNTDASRGLMAWGAGYGFMLGMAVGGPLDDNDTISGGAVALGVAGIAAGIGGGYLVSKRLPLSRGQVAAITSAGTWTGVNAAFVGDLATDTDTDTNDIYKSVAVGGAVGLGVGALYIRFADIDEDDVAFTNSLAGYGLASGLLLGVAISPPRSEAYSINGMVGSIGGIAGGLLLSDRFGMSRRRTLLVDLGAALGAGATWGLLYPLIRDESTNNDEQFAGAFSVVTLWGGAAVSYYLTRDNEPAPAEVAERHPAPPGLLRRAGSGRWSLGGPLLRPMNDPALAPPAGVAMGIDLASGRF